MYKEIKLYEWTCDANCGALVTSRTMPDDWGEVTLPNCGLTGCLKRHHETSEV